MKFIHPDPKLQTISRYYLKHYGKEQKNYFHNLNNLSKIPTEYFCIDNPFSFDDERYTLYPNHGWIEQDYERILELNLEDAEDLKEFRLIAANFARVLLNHPEKIKQMQDYPHFEAILEFILIEGSYEYFSISAEKLLLVCVQYKLLRAGDSGALSMTKALILKAQMDKMNSTQKLKIKAQQFLLKINQKIYK